MSTRLTCTALFALVGLACTSDVSSVPPPAQGYGGYDYGVSSGYGSSAPVPAPSDTSCASAPAYAQVSAFAKCAGCHSSTKAGAQRNGAPSSVNFDAEALADASANRAASVVMAGIMPPPGSSVKLTDAEKQQLYDYAMCKL
jgi:uncharacterized membrane protein